MYHTILLAHTTHSCLILYVLLHICLTIEEVDGRKSWKNFHFYFPVLEKTPQKIIKVKNAECNFWSFPVLSCICLSISHFLSQFHYSQPLHCHFIFIFINIFTFFWLFWIKKCHKIELFYGHRGWLRWVWWRFECNSNYSQTTIKSTSSPP